MATLKELMEKLEGYGFTDKHGHPLENCVDFMNLIEALPRALEWTEEPPRTVGMYWWRQDPCSKYWVYKVRLVPAIHGLITYGHKGSIHVEDIGGQWAGPIPEPQEPKGE